MTLIDWEIRPVAGRIGAEIVGLDLAVEQDDATIEQVRAALLRWKVLFFRDQRLEPEAQLAFARRFRPITKAHPTVPGLRGQPDVLDVDAHGGNIAIQWHTDVTSVDRWPRWVVRLSQKATSPQRQRTMFS